MKREASVWRKFLEAVPSARKLAAFMGTSVMLLSASGMAQSDALKFTGQLVNTGCHVAQASAGVTDNEVRYLQISGVRVQISAARDACAEKDIPFTLQYESLPVALQTGIQNPDKSQTGLIIVTYQ
ncbi:hypothetical protein OH710_23275 [Pseudomonas capsici]|uniref:hypothetical protein n=1 Tax=Pseudomonas capsici TaxID=2810614 RepID=UPI0021F0CA56|nr:hypothetical protein [Pseudomonas capsici]MCV4275569.1 hypothetical protein [Pseudomonas capsici]